MVSWKGLAETNTPAYLAADGEAKKLDCLFLVSLV